MSPWLYALPVAAYLYGSVPFGFLAALWLRGVDIRKVGSGNIGATNAARALGFRFFPIIFLLDVSKGMLPTLAAVWLAGPGGAYLSPPARGGHGCSPPSWGTCSPSTSASRAARRSPRAPASSWRWRRSRWGWRRRLGHRVRAPALRLPGLDLGGRRASGGRLLHSPRPLRRRHLPDGHVHPRRPLRHLPPPGQHTPPAGAGREQLRTRGARSKAQQRRGGHG